MTFIPVTCKLCCIWPSDALTFTSCRSYIIHHHCLAQHAQLLDPVCFYWTSRMLGPCTHLVTQATQLQRVWLITRSHILYSSRHHTARSHLRQSSVSSLHSIQERAGHIKLSSYWGSTTSYHTVLSKWHTRCVSSTSSSMFWKNLRLHYHYGTMWGPTYRHF